MKTAFQKAWHKERSFFKAVPALVWQLLFFYMPIGFIILLSFSADSLFDFSLTHYKELMQPAYFQVIWNSFVMAFTTAVVTLLISYPIAYYVTIKNPALKTIFVFLLIIPFWTNFLVLTYAWFFLLDRTGLVNTILLKLHFISEPLSLLNNWFAVLIVMVYAYLPFMIMPIYTSLEKFDMTLLEASGDLGASMRETFWRIIFPLSKSGVLTGFLLVFVPSFGEFAIPMLVGGYKTMFVGTLISHYFFIGQNKFAGAAFTVLSSLVLGLLVLCITMVFGKRNQMKDDTYVEAD